MIIRTEINSAADATRNFKSQNPQIPDGKSPHPPSNSVEGLRQMGLLVPGKSNEVERTVIFPGGEEVTIRVKPVTRVIRDIATQTTIVFTAFYPEKSTLLRIHNEFYKK